MPCAGRKNGCKTSGRDGVLEGSEGRARPQPSREGRMHREGLGQRMPKAHLAGVIRSQAVAPPALPSVSTSDTIQSLHCLLAWPGQAPKNLPLGNHVSGARAGFGGSGSFILNKEERATPEQSPEKNLAIERLSIGDSTSRPLAWEL